MKVVAGTIESLSSLVERIKSTWSPYYSDLDVTMLASQGYPHLPMSPNDLIDLCGDLIDRLELISNDQLNSSPYLVSHLENITNRCDAIIFTSINTDINAVAKSTFDFLFWASSLLPPRAVEVNWDRVDQRSLVPKELSARLRTLEARLTDLEPRSEQVKAKIDEIDAARDSADTLPVVMAELKRNEDELRKLMIASQRHNEQIAAAWEDSNRLHKSFEDIDKSAKELIKEAERTFRIAVSGGLASAFSERAKSLSYAGIAWIALLVVSIGFGVGIGTWRLDQLHSLLTKDADSFVVSLNVLASIIGIGGPIWLAWLSTKNISQSFRLAEDYAYKASISKAYEGYRTEALRLDPKFANKLFDSALDRLDELPSRVLHVSEPTSPVAELLGNENFKAFASEVPEIANRVIDALSAETAAKGGLLASLLTRRSKSAEVAVKSVPPTE